MWVLIPVKDLSSSKSRLARQLPPQARQALMAALLTDLLATLRQCQAVSGITVLTRCPHASQLAREAGAEVLALPEDRCLNSGVSAGVAVLSARGLAAVTVMHADLPLVEAPDIDTLLRQHRSGGQAVTLVPDTARDGTTMIVLQLPTRFTFAYGPQSFARHCEAAERAGLAMQVISHDRLGFDIDLWQDLAPLLSLPANSGHPGLGEWLKQHQALIHAPRVANL